MDEEVFGPLHPGNSDIQAEGVGRSEALAVLSLLCLWPFGNSLTETVHSEFYQCHTQNRSRALQPADPAEASCPLSRPQNPAGLLEPLPPHSHSSATLLTPAWRCLLAQSDLQGEKDNRRKTDCLDLQRAAEFSCSSPEAHILLPSPKQPIFLPRSASNCQVLLRTIIPDLT